MLATASRLRSSAKQCGVFSLSLRDVELILAERGVLVTHESIRNWSRKFGAEFAMCLRRLQRAIAIRAEAFRIWRRETPVHRAA